MLNVYNKRNQKAWFYSVMYTNYIQGSKDDTSVYVKALKG